MADPEKNVSLAGASTKTPTGTTNPESPTTARPLDFDDEPQESGVTPTATPTTNRQQSTLGPGAGTEDDGAPPKPPRPVSPQQQAEKDLKDAFPAIDSSVIKAVLVASGGNIERAFEALLGMSDPSAQPDVAPARPPRSDTTTSTSQRQLEADELYARQLAEHYGGAGQRGRRAQSGWDDDPRQERSRGETGLKPNELYDDREHNFFDDDLPVIRDNIRKGFLETQSKVNSWVANFKKQLDGEESEEDEFRHVPQGPPREGFVPNQGYGNRRSTEARRSADRERYDADPQILSDNFTTLEMKDNEAPPPRPPRPQANPDLFKTKTPSPDRRKVSFQEGPPEEIQDSYSGGSTSNNKPASGTKSSKWQPLSEVEPSPIGDNDPFSLGDSDDEKDTKNKDNKSEEAKPLDSSSGSKPEGETKATPTDKETS